MQVTAMHRPGAVIGKELIDIVNSDVCAQRESS
jgi:hypothetical protein